MKRFESFLVHDTVILKSEFFVKMLTIKELIRHCKKASYVIKLLG